MSGHFLSTDRETPMLLSPSLQDWLPANHLARLVVETVERLGLRAIEDSYAGRGERAYRPKMLVALLLYGYATGIFSSRKLQHPSGGRLLRLQHLEVFFKNRFEFSQQSPSRGLSDVVELG